MKLSSLANRKDVAKAAADMTAEVLERKPEARIVLPAGATPIPYFKELVRREARGEIDLSSARVFQLDEYVGVKTHDDRSFHSFLRGELLDKLEVPPGHLQLLDGASGNVDREIRDHGAALRNAGGADLAILGCGINGHVGFNEPGSTLESTSRLVRLRESTRRGARNTFGPRGAPTHGMTLGMDALFRAKRVLILVTGAGKRRILDSLLHEVPGQDRPASLLFSHSDLDVLADGSALGSRRSTIAN